VCLVYVVCFVCVVRGFVCVVCVCVIICAFVRACVCAHTCAHVFVPAFVYGLCLSARLCGFLWFVFVCVCVSYICLSLT